MCLACQDFCRCHAGTSYPEPESGPGHTCDSDSSSDYGVYCFVGDASDNPTFGLISFDNILWSWLTIFQCVSLEGWTEVMYAVQVCIPCLKQVCQCVAHQAMLYMWAASRVSCCMCTWFALLFRVVVLCCSGSDCLRLAIHHLQLNSSIYSRPTIDSASIFV